MKVPVTFVENVIKFEKAEYEGERMVRRDLAPGSAVWCQGNRAFDFVCPCGCSTVHALPVSLGVKPAGSWLWNGNVEKPTLMPSIQCTTPCGWHGWLTDGVFHT